LGLDFLALDKVFAGLAFVNPTSGGRVDAVRQVGGLYLLEFTVVRNIALQNWFDWGKKAQ